MNNIKESIYTNKPWGNVLEFWFNSENESKWFIKSEEFDNGIKEKFYDVWKSGCEGLLYEWREDIYGRLAEIIVLDQFSRNLCRGKSCAFSQDTMALVLAQEAIKLKEFDELTQDEKNREYDNILNLYGNDVYISDIKNAKH